MLKRAHNKIAAAAFFEMMLEETDCHYQEVPHIRCEYVGFLSFRKGMCQRNV